MPTILSRFDMIFIIKDLHDQQRDMVRRPHRSVFQTWAGHGADSGVCVCVCFRLWLVM